MLTLSSRIACATQLGECALWHAASGNFLWLDLLDPALLICGPDGADFVRHPLPLAAPLGGLVATSDPDIVIIGHGGMVSLLSLGSLEITPFAEVEPGRDGVSINDMKVDRFGRLWIGTSDLAESAPRGAIWCLAPDGSLTLGDAGFIVSNGPAVSPDGATMYFADTISRRILAYELRESKPYLGLPRPLISFDEAQGYPDGLTVDEEGAIWIAHWEGSRLSRWSADGRMLGEVTLPARNITSVAFGGMNCRTLFVTSAIEGVEADELSVEPGNGMAFILSSPVSGLAEPLFSVSTSAS